MADIEMALEMALKAHRGQKDRRGEPYILHPLRVMSRVTIGPQQIVALLHDVVEDSDITLEDLRSAGFSEPIVAAVDALTRRADEGYAELVLRASRDRLAHSVKLADLADHLDSSRIAFRDAESEQDMQRLRRYARAAMFLQGETTEQEYLSQAAPDERRPKR